MLDARTAVWSPDGAAICYTGSNQNVYRVRVKESADDLEISAPEEVFWIDTARGLFRGMGGNIEMFPDGERFLLNRNAANFPEEMPISLVFNGSRGLGWE